MPRYVILSHDHPFLHWDLMLEAGGTLRTWRLAEPPQAGKTIAAEALGEHRVAYLDYEGPVSGDRGHVGRWDWGEFVAQVWLDDEVRVVMTGEKYRGMFQLRQRDGAWTFEYACERKT